MAVKDLRYTPDSLRFRDFVQERIWIKLRTLVQERVAQQNRGLVTEDDIKACIAEAAEMALHELQEEGVIGPTTPPSE